MHKLTTIHSMHCIITIFLFKFAGAFNFDTNFPIVYTNPYNFSGSAPGISSYFGYSVLLYPGGNGREPWIQIGAPRGANPLLGNTPTGIVFRCGIKSPCNPLNMFLNEGIADEAFFGYTMDISEDNSIYATCGHRWIKNTSLSTYYMQGACFSGNTNDTRTEFITPLNSLHDQVLEIVPGTKIYNKGQGQIGFSAQFSKEKTELVVGVPGFLNWKGAPALLGESITPPASRRRRRDADLGGLVLPDGTKLGEIKYFDLAGYSVTSGRFYDKELYFVTGTPRSDVKGAVLIFRFQSNHGGLDVREKKNGNKFGEYFGSSVTASDINGDGLDDLIVGAPFSKSSDSKFDEGAIYIYLGSKARLEVPSTSTISGRVNGGRFGESLMSLGDIDKDGYSDIAVAAPYENENSGVVYIFRGDKHEGLNKEPSQIIAGKDIIPNVRGFGISLSKPTDIDGNQYSDFAIGAYKSGHAVLLRGKPVVYLKHDLSSSIKQVNIKDRQFSFNITSCVAFFGLSITPPIRIVRSISVDRDVPDRAYLENPPSGVTELRRENETNCDTFTVRIKEQQTNIYDPIVIKASVDLEKTVETKDVIQVTSAVTGDDRFCRTCAILNPYNVADREKQVNVDFNKGCGDDNVCNSNLFMSVKFVNFDNAVYIVGSQNYITMEATVTNTDENAFQTEIHIVLPEPVRLRSMPSYCKESASQISCSIGNPLALGSSKTAALELDLDEVNNGKYEEDLEFLLTVTTSSNNNGEKEKKLSLKLVKNADVELIGQSSEESYSYVNRSYGFAAFQQVFKVLKHDISPIQRVELTLDVPLSISVNNKDVKFLSVYPPEGSLGGQPITCRSDFDTETDNTGLTSDMDGEKKKRKRRDTASEEPVELSKYPVNRTIYLNCSDETITCGRVQCSLGPFKSVKSVAEIKLKMKLNISELVDYMVEKDIVIVSTRAEVQISDIVSHNNTFRHKTSAASVFVGASAELSIATWIIIISVICGILLLLIVAGVLYKCGFFKRTKKELLMKEKGKSEKTAVRT